MTYCKFCDKEVEAVLKKNRYYCPDCNKYVKMTKEEREEPQVSEISEEEMLEEPSEIESEEKKSKHYKKREPMTVQEGPTKLVMAPKTIKYDAADLHMGEILINLGYAKDLNDLTRKNMKLAFSLMNMGAVGKQFNTMETNNEPNPERTMKQIQEQEMMKGYIESMKKGSQDPMMTMIMMRMLDNKEQGKSNNNVLDKMLEIQMMKSVMGGQNSDTSGLQREIAELKHNMQMQQILSQQQQVQQGNTSSQEFMQKMEQIRSERDRDVKQAEINAQKEREKNLQLAFDNRRVELESRLQAMEKEMKEKSSGSLATNRIKEMKEEIAAIKEMSTVLGDREKGTGEMLLEGLAPAAEKIIPALVDLGKQRQQQQMMSQQIPPPTEQLPELPPEQPNPEPNPHGLTPTEQQMSEQMESMYLHPSEKKKQ